MATVLAAIHPAVISAIIPANVPAARVSIRPVTSVRIRPIVRVRVGPVILRLVRLIVGAHITVIGPISITGHAGWTVIPTRIIAVPAAALARIRFIRLHTQCCQNKRGCESNVTQLH